jgi:hypothetical protein
MRKCVLNLATRDGWYPLGQQRLFNSLHDVGFDGDIITLLGEKSVRSPMHNEVSYAFKAYAMKKVYDAGYDMALWLDCSAWAIKPIDVVFDIIAEKGHYFESCGWSLGQFSSDASLAKANLDRESAFYMPMLSSGMTGINFRTDKGKQFVQKWYDMANDGVTFNGDWTNLNNEISNDNRVKGHRHDQTAASIIAHELGMHISEQHYFEYFTIMPRDCTVILLQGM